MVTKENAVKLNFKKELETKGAIRFMEVDDQGNQKTEDFVIGTLYVRKTGLAGSPAALTLTIEVK